MHATSEQILCKGDFIFTARVLTGSCEKQTEDTQRIYCGGISLAVRVTKLFALKQPVATENASKMLGAGMIVAVTSTVSNGLHDWKGASLYKPGTNKLRVGPIDYGQISIDPPTGMPLSDDEMASLFIGKDFIFSVRLIAESTPLLWSAKMWRIEREGWAKKTIRSRLGTSLGWKYIVTDTQLISRPYDHLLD